MIGMDDLCHLACIVQALDHFAGDALIVNSPAFVICSGVGAEAPPAVFLFGGVDGSEGVCEATLGKPFGHPSALFREESGRVFIAFRVMDVHFGMSDVIVPDYDQIRALLFKLLYKLEEVIQEFHLKLLSFFSGCSGGKVAVEKGPVVKISSEAAPFPVVFF